MTKVRLISRQKLLLAFLEAFGGKLGSMDMQKYLFLFTEICQIDKSYEFVPYKYGCLSLQSYADIRYLAETGLVSNSDNVLRINDSDANYLSGLPTLEKNKILWFQEKYKNLSSTPLIQEVYKKYPYYTINSKIAGKIMSDIEMDAINDSLPKTAMPCLFTIGYEGASIDNYLNRLIKNNVKLLCDVRKNPISRKYGFSQKTLTAILKQLNIEYIHMPELGINSDKRQSLYHSRIILRDF